MPRQYYDKDLHVLSSKVIHLHTNTPGKLLVEGAWVDSHRYRAEFGIHSTGEHKHPRVETAFAETCRYSSRLYELVQAALTKTIRKFGK
jgi:hypothetical protein